MSLLTLVFAVLSLVFFLLFIFLRIPLPLYPLMSYQDALDILTPLVLIPVYWLLFKYAAGGGPNLWEEIAFMVLAALWVEGQGMHLAANSGEKVRRTSDRVIHLHPSLNNTWQLAIARIYLWRAVRLARKPHYLTLKHPTGSK